MFAGKGQGSGWEENFEDARQNRNEARPPRRQERVPSKLA